MSITIYIPARWGSSRFPGKPLFKINGKPMIQHTYEAACRAGWASHRQLDISVLTDDPAIYDTVIGFDGNAILTMGNHINGTERCAELVRRRNVEPDRIIINWQGDAPLTPVNAVHALIRRLEEIPDAAVATPIFREDAASHMPSKVSVITDLHDRRALYFTRNEVPFLVRDGHASVNRHIGLYAYRAWALDAYGSMPVGRFERTEDLEQLRFIEHGIDVQTVMMDTPERPLVELNTPEDVGVMRELLR